MALSKSKDRQESPEDREAAGGVRLTQDALLTDGIGEDVSVFGRTLHIQTELRDGFLKTEVFCEGRMITTRSAELGDDWPLGDAEAQRRRMIEHHQAFVSTTRERARRHERGSAPRSDSDRTGRSRDRVERASDLARRQRRAPEDGTVESAELGLRISELFGDFRRRIAKGGGAGAERLERASQAFAWIVATPLFEHTRLDDQLRIHLLRDQIAGWVREGRDPRRATELGRDLERLAAHLGEIEHRAELRLVKGASAPDGAGRAEKDSLQPLSKNEREVGVLPSPQPGPSQSSIAGSQEENLMAKVNLEPLTAIDGFVGTCLVDSESGMMLGAHGGGSVNLELAAAGNTQVVRAKHKTMTTLKLDDKIEDILISLGKQYHLIRLLESNPRIFIYLVLDRSRANLAMARLELKSFEESLSLG